MLVGFFRPLIGLIGLIFTDFFYTKVKEKSVKISPRPLIGLIFTDFFTRRQKKNQ
jgi:hypothetical protein